MLIDKSKLVNANGQKYLRRLFIEQSYQANDRESVSYTLSDTDHHTYPSLYRLYLEENDPSEYRFAEKYFVNYQHWKLLCDCSWFQPTLFRMREALEQKIQSDLLEKVDSISKDTEHRNQFEAIKLLLSKPWKDKLAQKGQRGRPSKEEIRGRLKEVAAEEQTLQEEFKRVSGEA